jgi:tetratricopeptide (TPR) repeat protein
MSKIADNPYPGSRAFRQADQALFFGRGDDTKAIVDLWMTNRLTIVSGPVASGKTSLLHAGVYPLMPVKRSRILPIGDLFHGLTFPFPALPDRNPFTLALLTSWSPEDVPTRLAGLSISDFVRRFARGENGAIYAAIDQLDDLLLDPLDSAQSKWRHQFLAELTQAMTDHPRLHLLLVTRSAALGFLASSLGGGAQRAIAPLTAAQAIEAVTGPARTAGRCFTEEAAYRVIGDLSTPGTAAVDFVEPSLLQVVCWQLWEGLPPGVTAIDDWSIREFGEADTALATRCGHVIGEVAALYDIPSRRLRSWLADNFVTDRGTRDGVHEGRQATAGQPNAVLRSLLDRHLLTSETDESVRYYRLLTSRLIEPLWKAGIDRPTAPTAAEYLQAAERELALGELDFARTHAKRALRAPASLAERAQAETLLGNVEHQCGKPGEALPHYRDAAELLQATGDTAAAAHQLAAAGQLLLAEGDVNAALTELRVAAERVPNDLELQTQLALALWQLGDGRTAVAILNWVLTIEGGHPGARRARGEILADLGEPRDAMLDLDRSVPDRPSSRAARGLALAELGDHAAAAKEINGAVAEARRSGLVLLYAARASELAGDNVSAKDRAKEAIDATDPPLYPAHKQLARKLAGRRLGITRPYPGRSATSSAAPRAAFLNSAKHRSKSVKSGVSSEEPCALFFLSVRGVASRLTALASASASSPALGTANSTSSAWLAMSAVDWRTCSACASRSDPVESKVFSTSTRKSRASLSSATHCERLSSASCDCSALSSSAAARFSRATSLIHPTVSGRRPATTGVIVLMMARESGTSAILYYPAFLGTESAENAPLAARPWPAVPGR